MSDQRRPPPNASTLPGGTSAPSKPADEQPVDFATIQQPSPFAVQPPRTSPAPPAHPPPAYPPAQPPAHPPPAHPAPAYPPPAYPPRAPAPQAPAYPPQAPVYSPQAPGYPPQAPAHPALPMAPRVPSPAHQPQPRSQPAPPAMVPTSHGTVLKRSFGRAFRLRIEPDEISPSERTALLTAGVTDPLVMAFLAWRRSVLLLVAIALIPLTVFRFADGFREVVPDKLRFLYIVPAIAEATLCAVCWLQLSQWTRWVRQRRVLFLVWLIFMAAPFAVYLIPLESVFGTQLLPGELETIKVAVALSSLLVLAPKAVSLLAGTLRAGLVTKMLFAGAAGPGWAIAFVAPIYTLFVFTLLIVPYQLTGSGWLFAAMAALLIAQISLGRAGYRLAKPMTHTDAVALVGRARRVYVAAMVAFALFIIGALHVVIHHIGVMSIVTTVLGFETNVLILTLIGTDFLIVNLERARGLTAGTTELADDTARKLAAFVNGGRGPSL